MHYSGIKYCDIANGPGVRTVLFVSGCRNHCEGCFQPETWDFANGMPFDEFVEEELLDSLKPSYVAGLTLLGGDPFEEENQKAILPFLGKVKEQYPEKSIWAYTGYVLERDLVPGGGKYTDVTEEILSCLDVLVDGPFVQEQKNIALKFRGSENQRLIPMGEYLATGRIQCL
ncbi:MAG: anaerobic ribonucleoside-triphosphate reductase activating protein [Lachnospiraceae bacterium]|nr:anaerobic ribonucleoside-triphosphate reductase activating protein [Lachnospiraceae bacterium]